jgi:hypothetical protein
LEVDVADNKILLLGGAAVVYYAYTQGWLSSLGIGAPAAAAPAAPVALLPVAPVVVPDQNAITGANTVAGIQARVLLNAKAPAEGLPIDTWGWFLNQELAPLGKTAPDPLPLFLAASPGFDRSQLVTAAQYWPVMTPALKAQTGLSGLGMYVRTQ